MTGQAITPFLLAGETNFRPSAMQVFRPKMMWLRAVCSGLRCVL